MSEYLKKRFQHILDDRPLPEKKIYKLKPVSDKRKKKLAELKEAETKRQEEKTKLPYYDATAADLKKDNSMITLSDWFDLKMRTSTPICMECGMEAYWLLEPKNENIWKACQAHILPKKKEMFPSIATNLDNHMILFPSWGGHLCGCHGFYDSGWYNATTMKVWDKIVVKTFVEKLYPNIALSERRKIPEALLKQLKQTTL